MAREGWTASEQALEGPQGFFAVLGAGDLHLEHLATLGRPWKILTTGVAVKPYPSCACTHSIIDGARELRERHRLRPEDIREVTVGVHASVPNILIHDQPRTGLEAKFSLSPDAWEAATARATRVCAASSPRRRAAAAAAPSVPSVQVACQPCS